MHLLSDRVVVCEYLSHPHSEYFVQLYPPYRITSAEPHVEETDADSDSETGDVPGQSGPISER